MEKEDFKKSWRRKNLLDKDKQTIYEFLKAQVETLLVTNDREAAARYIGFGYSIFAVPQMFGQEAGIFVLGIGAESKPISNGMAVLEQYEQDVRNHIFGGSSSFGQVKDNH